MGNGGRGQRDEVLLQLRRRRGLTRSRGERRSRSWWGVELATWSKRRPRRAEEEPDVDATSMTRVLFERLGLPEEPMVGSEGIKSNTAEFGSWVSDAVE
jgi:hypothetical protein